MPLICKCRAFWGCRFEIEYEKGSSTHQTSERFILATRHYESKCGMRIWLGSGLAKDFERLDASGSDLRSLFKQLVCCWKLA